ncbi:hypothetical protein ACFQU1_00025 [Chelatococcus sp. GCM10030263]|uniref:hypothetical protein n=1 Tax=Chelatococcus sp. GCM10030263 TaxID=3273387 RepID=UPI00361778D9
MNALFRTQGRARLRIQAPRLTEWAVALCIVSVMLPLKVVSASFLKLDACVSQNFDKLQAARPFSIRLEQTGVKPTDSPDRYQRYVSALQALVDAQNVNPKHATYFMTSPMYFKKNGSQWTHFGAGVLCARRMGSKENQCRNRTYTFFRPFSPEKMAGIVMSDLVSFIPTIPKCPTQWLSGAPRPADSW